MRPHLIATLRAAQRLDETGTGEVAAGTLGGTFNYMSGIRRQPNASGEAAVGERIEGIFAWFRNCPCMAFSHFIACP